MAVSGGVEEMSDRAINLPDLEQCPFCGESDELIVFGQVGDTCYVQCQHCHAGGPEAYDRWDAIEAWNEAKR